MGFFFPVESGQRIGVDICFSFVILGSFDVSLYFFQALHPLLEDGYEVEEVNTFAERVTEDRENVPSHSSLKGHYWTCGQI